MKKFISIMTPVPLLGWTSIGYCAEVFGYPIVEKQARFYTIILGLIAVSMALVGIAYLSFWLIDWKKKAAHSAKENMAYSGKLAEAGQVTE